MSTTATLNSVLAATTGSSSTEIDVTAAVNAILYADRAPERLWQAEQSTLATQTSEIDQLQSESSDLTDQLNALQSSTGALGSVTVTSSDSGLVTATAAAGTTILPHTIVVNNLATTASAYSAEVTSSSTQLSSGSLQIQVGTTTTTIPIGSGDGTADTLTELAATINSDSLGVTASVITDANGARLSLVANSSGSAAGFTIPSATGLTFTATAGVNAYITADGVPIYSASNTVTGAISGVTLNLNGADSGSTVNLTLAPNTTAIENSITDFVNAYNTLITDVNSQFSYNSATEVGGALQTDTVIEGFQSDILTAASYSTGSASLGTVKTLASFGITTNSDGTLSIDTSSLEDAVTNNFSELQNFFQDTAADSFVNSFETKLNTYTDTSKGAFTVELSSLSSEDTDLADQVNTLEVYLASQQTLLTTEYNNADIALAQLPQSIKQVDALLNPNSSSS